MSAVQFVPQGSCLLAHTVRTLLAQEPTHDYRRFVVVLPTARLGHYLLSALAAGGEEGGDQEQRAILPPTVVTLAGFFRLLDPAPEGRALGPAALSLTLKRLISAESRPSQALGKGSFHGELRHIHPHHAGELLVLYKELMEHGLWDDWFQTLTDYVAGECYHHPLHLDSIMARFTEVHGLLERWRCQLTDAQLTPQVDADNARAERVAAALLEGAEHPQAIAGRLQGRTVIAAGLTSMAPSWLKVWEALLEWGAEREADAVQFIFPEPPPLSSGDHPMSPLLDSVGVKLPSAAAQKAAAIRRAPEDIVVVEAEDAIAEVAWVVRQVSQLLEGDLAPSQIAVLVPSESQYSSLVAGGLREAGFSYNAAIAQPLSAATIGSWWLAFAEALAQPNAPLQVFGALRHPLTIKLILNGRASSSHTYGPRFWQRIYEALTAHKPLPERMSLSVVTDRVAEAYPEDLAPWRVLMDGFAEWVAMTSETQPSSLPSSQHAEQAYGEPAQQLKKALNWVYDHGLSPQQRNEPLEESAYRGIADLLDQLALVPSLAPSSFGASADKGLRTHTEFWQHILEANQTLAIRVVGEPMAGVQILSLAEARWLPVQVAFVLGCNEGFFPRALPSDELIGDSLKKRLGLKGWQGLEAMEDLSYSLMSARIPKVFLCRPLSFAGEETVPSRFVEQLRGEGHHPQIFVEAQHAPHGNTALSSSPLDEGHEREGVFPKAWTGDWLTRLSATATDRFLGCPYRYALDRLRLTDIESPLKDESAQQQGQLLHTILQDFHEGLEAIQLPPLPVTLPRAGAEQALMDRLTKLLRHHMPAEERSGPDGVQLREVGFARYVDHVLTLSETTGDTVRLVRGASERDIGEQSEDTAGKAAVQLGRTTRQLIGQIDRIDRIGGGLVITDFKRKGIVKTIADGIPSAQLLLYAKALEALEEGMSTERMILGYWSILKGEWEVLAVGADVRDTARAKGLATSRTPTIAELWARLDVGFSTREEQVSPHSPVGGHYFADDSACGFCSYAGLCRKNDPGWQSQPTSASVQPYAQTGSEEGHA